MEDYGSARDHAPRCAGSAVTAVPEPVGWPAALAGLGLTGRRAGGSARRRTGGAGVEWSWDRCGKAEML